MTHGWSKVCLGDLFTLDLDYVPVDASASYEMTGVLSFGRGLFSKPAVGGADTSYKTFYRLHRGQIVLSQLFGWEGAIAPVTTEFEGRLVSSMFPTFRPKANLNENFARWLIRSPMLWDQLRATAKGMGDRRRTLSPEIFFSATSLLPTLQEQQRIAAKLDAIEFRLTRVAQIRQQQSQKLQGSLRSTFHRLIANAKWRPLSEVAPLAWREVKIEPTASYTEFGVRSFYKGIFLRRKVQGSVFDWQELFTLKTGDIVFSNIMAWEKAIAVAGPKHEGWVGNHRMLICEPRKDIILASCLFHYFLTEDGFAKILKASPGTAARNKTLKADHLMAIEVPVPEISEQREFQKLLDLHAQVTTHDEGSRALTTALLPSLLDRIFDR